MAVRLLFAAISPALALADPCAGLYGAEALTCAWEADVSTCIQNECRGCAGEQCQHCRQDSERIHQCCDKHWHSTTPPKMCAVAEVEEDIKTCVEEQCHCFGGEQCDLCHEDAVRVAQCCAKYDASARPEICKVEQPDVDPCAGLYGAEALTCAWEADAGTCIDNKCAGCFGEQCQLCRQEAATVHRCCQDHRHSTTPPKMCADAFVDTCMEEQCDGCGGEQCRLCREDASHIEGCCSKHEATGASGICAARAKQAIVP
eukprot:s1206_g18.t1